MKRIMWFICFVSTFQCSISLSQTKNPEFSFRLFFEDGAGNQDTVTIGYASDATIGIDSIYGEQDISGNAFDAEFEVRVSSDVDYLISPDLSPHSKTKINFVDCGSGLDVLNIYPIHIRMNTQPLTIRWDQSQFDSLNFPCHQASYLSPRRITVQYPYGALLEGINVRLSSDSIMIRNLDNWVTNSYEAPTEGGEPEKINLIWFVLQRNMDVSVSNDKKLHHQFKHIYLNEILTLHFPQTSPLLELIIYDLTGKSVFTQQMMGEHQYSVNLSNLNKGIYYFSIYSTNGEKIYSGKFIR